MNRIFLPLFLFFLISAQFGFSQNVPGIAWKKVFGDKGDQKPVDVLPTFDGNIAVLGSADVLNEDVFWMTVDKNGNKKASKVISLPGDDHCAAFCQTFDGGFVIVGTSNSDSTKKEMPWILKINETGDIVWQKFIEGHKKSQFFDVLQTRDGHLVLTGVTPSKKSSGSDIWVYSTYEDGTLRWEKNYGADGNDEGRKIVETAEGTLGIGGITSAGSGSQNLWLLNIDKEGNPLNYHIYGSRQWEEMRDLIPTSDGGFAIGGIAKTNKDNKGKGLKDFWLIKTVSTGEIQWQSTFGGSSNDGASGVAETIDGGFVLAGFTFSHMMGANKSAGYIVKADKKGNKVWEDNKIFATKSNDELTCAVTMMDGSIVVIGNTSSKSEGAKGEDIWVTHLVPESYIDHLKTTKLIIKDVVLAENGDKQLEEGEKAYLKITIENTGTNDAFDVDLILREKTGAPGLEFRKYQKIGVLRAGKSRTIFVPIEGKTGLKLGDALLEIFCNDISRSQSNIFEKSVSTMPIVVGSNFLDVVWIDPSPVENIKLEKTLKTIELSLRVKARSDKELMRKHFTVFVNGKPYRVGARAGETNLANLGKAKEIFQYEYTNRIQLEVGLNILEVEVVVGSKTTRTKPFKITLSTKPNLHILAIGIEHDDLNYTKDDAKAFAESFKHQNDGAFDKVYVTSLISGERNKSDIIQTNGDVLKSEFAQLRDKYNYTIYEQDLLIVFISSHGKNIRGEFKVVPSDFQIVGENSLLDFKKDIVEPLDALPCPKLLVVDACHSGSGETKVGFASGGKGDDEKAEKEKAKILVTTGAGNKSTNMIASCGANESSWEDRKWGHGAFTAAILAAFKNETCSDADGIYQATSNDDILTVGELYNFLIRRVPQMVKEAGKQGSQKPHMDPKQLMNLINHPIFEVRSLN